MMRTWMVEVTIAPRMGAAIGFMLSDPTPVAVAARRAFAYRAEGQVCGTENDFAGATYYAWGSPVTGPLSTSGWAVLRGFFVWLAILALMLAVSDVGCYALAGINLH